MPATTPRPPSSEQVAAFDRNAWPRSIGIPGRNRRNPYLNFHLLRKIAPFSGKMGSRRNSSEGTPMADKNRLKFKLPLFGEGEAEGMYGIAALVIVLVVAIVAVAVH